MVRHHYIRRKNPSYIYVRRAKCRKPFTSKPFMNFYGVGKKPVSPIFRYYPVLTGSYFTTVTVIIPLEKRGVCAICGQ